MTEAVTARLSGGLALLVKKQWSSFVERIHYLICTTTTTTTTKSADASTLTNDLNMPDLIFKILVMSFSE